MLSDRSAAGPPVVVVQVPVDWPTIILAAAAVITLAFSYFSMRRSRKATGAQLLFALTAQWDSNELRNQRRVAARRLLEHPAQPANETADVLAFFEALGVYVFDFKVLPLDAVWTMFASLLFSWAAATRAYLETFRTTIPGEGRQPTVPADKTMWENLLRLEKVLIRMDSKKRKLTEEQVRNEFAAPEAFLRIEATLGDESPPLKAVVTLDIAKPIRARGRLNWR